MKKLSNLDLFPIVIILLCFAIVILVYFNKKQQNIIDGIKTQVPNIARDSYKTGCIDSLKEFSELPENDIINICKGDSSIFSLPIEQLFDGNY